MCTHNHFVFLCTCFASIFVFLSLFLSFVSKFSCFASLCLFFYLHAVALAICYLFF